MRAGHFFCILHFKQDGFESICLYRDWGVQYSISIFIGTASSGKERVSAPAQTAVLPVDTGKEFSLSPLQQLHTCHAKST